MEYIVCISKNLCFFWHKRANAASILPLSLSTSDRSTLYREFLKLFVTCNLNWAVRDFVVTRVSVITTKFSKTTFSLLKLMVLSPRTVDQAYSWLQWCFSVQKIILVYTKCTSFRVHQNSCYCLLSIAVKNNKMTQLFQNLSVVDGRKKWEIKKVTSLVTHPPILRGVDFFFPSIILRFIACSCRNEHG